MRWAIDLDGVCYEWHRTARYMMNHYLGKDLPPLDEFWTGWWPSEEYMSKADIEWLFTEGTRLGLYRYGHMVKDTRVVLEELVRLGDEILIATTRPPDVEQDTRDWVDLFFKDIPLVDVMFFPGGTKANAPADVLVDDNPEVCKDWVWGSTLLELRDALLFDSHLNRGMEWQADRVQHMHIWRVNGWKEVLKWRMTRVNKTS